MPALRSFEAPGEYDGLRREWVTVQTCSRGWRVRWLLRCATEPWKSARKQLRRHEITVTTSHLWMTSAGALEPPHLHQVRVWHGIHTLLGLPYCGESTRFSTEACAAENARGSVVCKDYAPNRSGHSCMGALRRGLGGCRICGVVVYNHLLV